MELTVTERGVLKFKDAKIIYRNFAGEGSKYNREGDREVSVIIPNEDIKNALIEEGWNIKVKPPREEGDDPFMTMKVKVKYTPKSGPEAILKVGDRENKLDADTIATLDKVDIARVDLDIRPYDWGPINGKYGRTAYLQKIVVTQYVDNVVARYTHGGNSCEDETLDF